MKLPTGYTEVQYIQSSGAQCIDTDFIPNQDTRIDILAMPMSIADVSGTDGFTPYGAGELYNSKAFECYNANSQFEFNYGNSYGFLGSPTVGSIVYISHNKNSIKMSVNSGAELTQTLTSNTFTAPRNLLLFAIGRASRLYGKVRIYSCQIYDNSTLIRDYVPCINSDGEAGLYDTVNSKFYGNTGTGAFLVGPPRVRLPNGYKQLEYIQSSGMQYIDTEFKPNQDSHVMAKLSTSETGSHTVFGADLSWTDNGFALGAGFAHYGKETGTISGLNNGSLHEVDFNKNTISIDGSAVLTMGTSTFSISHNMALFANNRAGRIEEKTTMVLYYCQIYNGNTIVRNYIPCINPDGEIGLYDLVNSKFYANAGTGVFTAGPEVTWPSNDAIYVKVNGIWKQIDGIKLL